MFESPVTGTECLLGNRELTVGASWEAGPAESCIHHSFPKFLFNLAGTLPAPEETDGLPFDWGAASQGRRSRTRQAAESTKVNQQSPA